MAVMASLSMRPRVAVAQSVTIEGPSDSPMRTITPSFTVRARGFALARPLRVTLSIATQASFAPEFLLLDSSFVSNDTILTVQVTRALTSESQIFWRARVEAPGIVAQSDLIGPRFVPPWFKLISPNSANGSTVDDRRPMFVWSFPPSIFPRESWRYSVEILSQGRPDQAVAGLIDTTWQVPVDLQTNSSYRWRVRASLPYGAATTIASIGSFTVSDPDLDLPFTTILYTNFPNPFPSPAAFATCIWFDVAPPGARIALDVLDLRGNHVRTLIPGLDGVRDYLAGRYGRGAAGTGSSCDNRFVWDGTGNNGRTVAAGVYLLRFQFGLQAPVFKRMIFLGR